VARKVEQSKKSDLFTNTHLGVPMENNGPKDGAGDHGG
jgi:hypothetical protein